MAEKISTIILNVDLDCRLCYKKIRKTLSKFPQIQSQSFDQKKNTVTISGPFDPEQLSKCLSCRAGKSLKGFQIVKKPADRKPDKPPDKKADDAPKKAESPKKEAAPPKTPDPPKKADPKPELVPAPAPVVVPAPAPVAVPAPEPVAVPAPVPVLVKPAPEPVIPQPIRHPAWPPCGCGGVSYEGYGAGPCSSGWPIRGGGCNTFFSEEDTTCKTM